MASDTEGTCVNDPNFAVICSFLTKFASLCGITYPNFVDLQHMIENTQDVPQPLVDLHVKLLRKARKSVCGEKWERALIKFCHSYSNQDGWEIERFGYKKARVPVKLRILKVLLELQFDLNNKFKSEINKWSANDLRCQPIGRDKLGQNYWYHLDEDCNLRVYREDLDDETWEVVAQNREDLVHLVSQLSSNDPFKKESDPSLNEDSNSLEIEKPIIDTGQVEENLIGANNSTINSENTLDIDIKEASANITVNKEEMDNKQELKLDNLPITTDNRDSNKEINTNKLPEDLKESKDSNNKDSPIVSHNKKNSNQDDPVKNQSLKEKNIETSEDKNNIHNVSNLLLKEENSTIKNIKKTKSINDALKEDKKFYNKIKIINEVELQKKEEVSSSTPILEHSLGVKLNNNQFLNDPEEKEKQINVKETEREIINSNENKKEINSKENEKEINPNEIEKEINPKENEKEINPNENEKVININEIEKKINANEREKENKTDINLKENEKEINSKERENENKTEINVNEKEKSIDVEEDEKEIIGVKEYKNEVNLVNKSNITNNLDNKRLLDQEESIQPESKRKCLKEDNEKIMEVSEAIEEPLMLVQGEGSGKECETGNNENSNQEEKSNENKNKEKELPIKKSTNNSIETSTKIEKKLDNTSKTNEVKKEPEQSEKLSSISDNIQEKTNNSNEIKELNDSNSLASSSTSQPKTTGNSDKSAPITKKSSNSFKNVPPIETEKPKPSQVQGEASNKSVIDNKIQLELISHKDKSTGDISKNNNLDNQQKVPTEKFNKIQLKNYPDISFASLSNPYKEGNQKEEYIKSNTEEKSQRFFGPGCLKLPDSLIVKPIPLNKEFQTENSKRANESKIVNKQNPDENKFKEGTLKIKKPEDLNKTFELNLKEELSKKAAAINEKMKSKLSTAIHSKIPTNLIDSSISLSIAKSDDISEKDKVHNYKRHEKSMLPYSKVELEENVNLLTSPIKTEISISPKDKHITCNNLLIKKNDNFTKSTKYNQDIKSLNLEESPKFQRKLPSKSEDLQCFSSTTKEFPLTNEVKIEIIKNKKNDSFESNKSLPSTSGENINIGKNTNFLKFETKKIEGNITNETTYTRIDVAPIKIENDKKLTTLKYKKPNFEDNHQNVVSNEINNEKVFLKNVSPNKERNNLQLCDEKIENIRPIDKNLGKKNLKTKDLNDSDDIPSDLNNVNNSKEKNETIIHEKKEAPKKDPEVKKDKQFKQIKDICQIKNLKEIEIVDKDTKTNKKLNPTCSNQITTTTDNSLKGGNKIVEDSHNIKEIIKVNQSVDEKITNTSDINMKSSQKNEIPASEDSKQKINKESKDTEKSIKVVKESKNESTSSKNEEEKSNSKTNSNKGINLKKNNAILTKENDSKISNLEKEASTEQEKSISKINSDVKELSEQTKKCDESEADDIKKKIELEKEEIKSPEIKRKVLRRTANRITENKSKVENVSPSPKLNRKRSNPRVSPSPDSEEDDEEISQTPDNDCAGGKRPRLRMKKTPDIELRRNVEKNKLLLQKQGTSSEDNEESSPQRQKKSKNLQTTESKKKRRGRPVSRGRPNVKSTEQNISPDSSNVPPENEIIPENHAKKTQAKKKTKKILGLDIDEEALTTKSGEIDEQKVTPVRQSRRIAQIKIKEEAERRKLEELTLFQLKEDQKRKNEKDIKDSKSGKRKKRNQPSDDDDEADEDYEEEKTKKKKKKRKKKGNKFNENNPWASSSESSSSQEEEEHEPSEDEEEENLVFKSDHEFSPESDLEKEEEVQPTRRARTAQKESDMEEQADEHACQKCGKSDHPEWILLCDKCDSGWHCSCLLPALFVIPEGDWYCPPCEHTFLLEKLEENLRIFDNNFKKKENEELRKKRLAYVGISLDNVLPNKERDNRATTDEEGDEKHKNDSYSSTSESESDSSSNSSESEPVYQLRERRQTLFSYRFNEYDDLINSAIQDEMDAVKGAGNQGRGKDIANIVNAKSETEEKSGEFEKVELKEPELKEEITEKLPTSESEKVNLNDHKDKNEDQSGHSSESNEDEDDEIGTSMRKLIGRKKHRRLNNLDISSEDDAESDEDFHGTSSNDEEEDEEDFDDDPDDSSSDVGRRGRNRRGSKIPVRRSARTRTTRFDKEFINDDSDESEGPRKKKTRRLRIESDSEESDSTWGRRKAKKTYSSFSKPKSKKKKKSYYEDSDTGVFKIKKSKKSKVSYGLEEDSGIRKTRGCKINYQEIAGSDSEDDFPKKKAESEDEYVAEEDEEEIAQDEEGRFSESSEINNDDDDNKSKDNSSDPESKNIQSNTKHTTDPEESDDDLEGMENLDDELAQDQEFGEFIKNEEKDVAMVLNDAEITKTPSKEKECSGKSKKISETINEKKDTEKKSIETDQTDKNNKTDEGESISKDTIENNKLELKKQSVEKENDSETQKTPSENSSNFNTQSTSVITRILTQPSYVGQPSNFSASSGKYFHPTSTEPTSTSSPSTSSISYPSSPRGKVASFYRSPAPTPSSPNVNLTPFTNNRCIRTPGIRSRTPGNQNLTTQIYHSPHPMDPSPSGGGPITTNRTERSESTSNIHSSSIAVPGVSNTLSGKNNPSTPSSNSPSPLFIRSPHGRFSSNDSSTPNSLQQIKPSNFTSTSSNQSSNNTDRGAVSDSFLPFQNPASNYQFNAFPAGQNIASADNHLSQSTYQSSPYQESFPSDSSPNPTPADSDKPYEGEGGEFGGLVSYFSSQREEDLDT